MLEQLSEICSVVILRHVTLQNCTSILADASPLYSPKLNARIHEYVAVNMECLLEKRFLDDVAHDTMKELAAFVREQQAIKLPRTRSGMWLAQLAEKHKAWLDLQDFPSVMVRTCPPGRPARSLELSPSGPRSPKTPRRISSLNMLSTHQKAIPSPIFRPSDKQPQCDGMFVMDEEGGEEMPKLDLPATPDSSFAAAIFSGPAADSSVTSPSPVWKGLNATKAE
jgi:hypothetical protein